MWENAENLGEVALAVVFWESVFGCFPEGTEVACEDGWRPIEELRPGDLVWTCDPETGTVFLAEVLEAYRRTSDHLIVLTVGDEEIETTSEHPFWVVGRGWTKAGALIAGDALRTLGGTALPVKHIERRDGIVTVYNIRVAGAHTYFVSTKQVLVHNKGGGGRRGYIPKSAHGKSWPTQRRHYWKAKLKSNPRRFSATDRMRIKNRLSPTGSDGFSMELHHPPGAPPYVVEEMTRTKHRLGRNFRKNHPR